MKIAHNRKWRSATSLVEGLHYFFALFLEEKQQFITTRRGEKKMPQNKRESLIYTFIMCFMMVFWMSIYNVSLHMGGLSMESIKAGWLGFPIAYIFAMCCDWFFVSKIAKGFAFKYLVKPDSSVLRKVISVSCCMVVPMVIIMSLYGDGKFLKLTDDVDYKYSKEFCNGTSISVDHCRTCCAFCV